MVDSLSTAQQRGCARARHAACRLGGCGRCGRWRWAACAALLAGAVLPGCDGPPDRSPTLGDADVRNGRQLVIDKGCVACHRFADIAWPRGGLGPALDHFAAQGLIAGQLPNQPGVLMQFIRNAPALAPGSAMPAIPMTDQEARDVTAYLLQRQPR